MVSNKISPDTSELISEKHPRNRNQRKYEKEAEKRPTTIIIVIRVIYQSKLSGNVTYQCHHFINHTHTRPAHMSLNKGTTPNTQRRNQSSNISNSDRHNEIISLSPPLSTGNECGVVGVVLLVIFLILIHGRQRVEVCLEEYHHQHF